MQKHYKQETKNKNEILIKKNENYLSSEMVNEQNLYFTCPPWAFTKLVKFLKSYCCLYQNLKYSMHVQI